MNNQSAVKMIGPSTLKRSFFGLVAFGLLVLATVGLAHHDGRVAAQDGVAPSFTGAWRVTITPEGGPSFGGLSTYGADGTVTSSVLPVVPPMPGGPEDVSYASGGQGAIEEDGAGNATLTIVHYRANGNGEFIGAFTIRATITLDGSGQGFAGQFERTVTDPAGNVDATLVGTVEGVRIVAEAPSGATPTA